MITIKKTFSVEVNIPEGSFTCTFRRKKQNEALEDARVLSKLRKESDESDDVDKKVDILEQSLSRIGSTLEKIEGLADEDGNPVTVEQFKKNELYGDIVNAIISAYSGYINKDSDPDKKK